MSVSFRVFIRKSSINISADQWSPVSFWISKRCHCIGVAKRAAKIPQQKVSPSFLLSLKLLQRRTILSWEFQLMVLSDDSLTLVLRDSSSAVSGGGTLWSWLLLETSVDCNSSDSSLSLTSFNGTVVSRQAAFSTTSGGQLPVPSLLSSSGAGQWRKRGSPGRWVWVTDLFCGFCLAVLNLWSKA